MLKKNFQNLINELRKPFFHCLVRISSFFLSLFLFFLISINFFLKKIQNYLEEKFQQADQDQVSKAIQFQENE